ncbi:MAG: hypothetical protein GTO18_04245 [Anaerolineales bacterium]|nr:hypothetical protein [Anaerolineales bacterium]
MARQTRNHNIGTLNEGHLHANLKEWYAEPNDRFEVEIEGFVIDLLRDQLLIEFQTKNFSIIKRKLTELTERHYLRLVYPIPQEKWILKRTGEDNQREIRRKSPKRGTVEDVFIELVRIPTLIKRSNFELHVLLTQEEEVRRHEKNRAWRRKGWLIQERRLIKVVDDTLFRNPQDFSSLLPDTLPREFTTADLAKAIEKPRWLAQKMSYCLREMGEIKPAGKQGNAFLYTR